MPISRTKLKYVKRMRDKFKDRESAPSNIKWVFDDEYPDTCGSVTAKIKNFKSYTESLDNLD